MNSVLGELNSQRRLTEAESDMEIKEWERRNSEFALTIATSKPMDRSSSERNNQLVWRIGAEESTSTTKLHKKSPRN